MSKEQNATEQELSDYFARGGRITYAETKKSDELLVDALRHIKAKTLIEALQQDLRLRKERFSK